MYIQIKCTACKKTEKASQQQIQDARELGCYFSSCCHTVATVVGAEIKQPRDRKAS